MASEVSKMYNVDSIMELVEKQFIELMRDEYEYYQNYKIILSNEQYYVSPEDRQETNTIYIVIKFLPAEINYNQNVVPITITAVSEYNKLEVCQKLLLEYAQTYNLKPDQSENDIIFSQTYTTPQVMSNFSEVYYGYRTTFYMSGTFLLSYNANPETVYFLYKDKEGKEQEQQLEIFSFQEDFSIQLDTQAFTNTNGFTKSLAQVGTHTISFIMRLTNDYFCNLILDIVNNNIVNGISTDFKFKISRKNGKEKIATYKMKNYTSSRDIGEMPVMSCTFTN